MNDQSSVKHYGHFRGKATQLKAAWDVVIVQDKSKIPWFYTFFAVHQWEFKSRSMNLGVAYEILCGQASAKFLSSREIQFA